MAEFTLHLGDCIEVMRTLADNSVDAIVTDPPYHLTNNGGGPAKGSDNPYSRSKAGATSTGFMGHAWDGGDVAFRVEMWTEALRVLKPGGHLLAFSGTRTQHRMVCAIEDAGFEIRDQIGWAYGSGFPKSRNIAAQDMGGADAERWTGWGTALKPAWEPVCFARKPLVGTVAANVLQFGTGAINIEGCRVPVADAAYARNCSGDRGHAGTRGAEQEGSTNLHTGGGTAAAGRWPANLIHDGSDAVVALFPSQAGAQAPVTRRGADGDRKAYGAFAGNEDPAASTFQGDSGSAARFFYCAKATRKDRNKGCSSSDVSAVANGATMREREDADWPGRNGNHHPTVKPTDLMAYLVRLVTPPGGLVLDPFMGSGSTGKACMREGFHFIGIDMTPEYVAIARQRIQHEQAQGFAASAPFPQLDLFHGDAA